jgi:PAS domain-containing protein
MFAPVAVQVLSRHSRYWQLRGYLTRPPGQDLVVARISTVEPLTVIGNPIGVWRWDADRDIVTWSPELLSMFDLRLGPPASYTAFLDTIIDEDREDVARHIERARDHSDEFTATFRCTGRGEHQPWFHAAGRGTTTPAGRRHVAGIVKYLNPPRTWWTAAATGCG